MCICVFQIGDKQTIAVWSADGWYACEEVGWAVVHSTKGASHLLSLISTSRTESSKVWRPGKFSKIGSTVRTRFLAALISLACCGSRRWKLSRNTLSWRTDSRLLLSQRDSCKKIEPLNLTIYVVQISSYSISQKDTIILYYIPDWNSTRANECQDPTKHQLNSEGKCQQSKPGFARPAIIHDSLRAEILKTI